MIASFGDEKGVPELAQTGAGRLWRRGGQGAGAAAAVGANRGDRDAGGTGTGTPPLQVLLPSPRSGPGASEEPWVGAGVGGQRQEGHSARESAADRAGPQKTAAPGWVEGVQGVGSGQSGLQRARWVRARSGA